MNDDVVSVAEECSLSLEGFQARDRLLAPPIPSYLEETYWWAYLRPGAVWLFEREWLVNLILWGNMRRLTEAVLQETRLDAYSKVLQVACVYGDFSNRLASHLHASRSRLHVLDIAPIQLRNTRKKLAGHDNVSLHHQDSSQLLFADDLYDQTVVFFLLHEQPEAVRRKTVAEAIRVTRPGGKVVFVDYHAPAKTNPLRYVMYPVLRYLEPFALGLWRTGLDEFLPPEIQAAEVKTKTYFGGLYQKVVVQC